MRKSSESRLRANAKYDKANTKHVGIKLNYKFDMDIIKKLEEVPNKQVYIKELIRKDLANG